VVISEELSWNKENVSDAFEEVWEEGLQEHRVNSIIAAHIRDITFFIINYS
jgi:hypothetical protein